MEEKVLAKSFISEKWKKIFKIIIFSLLAISAVFLIIWIHKAQYSWELRCRNRDYRPSSTLVPFAMAFYYEEMVFLAVLHWFFLLLSGIAALMYFDSLHHNITITDKNVRGTTFFGKRVILPIHMISAYSYKKCFAVFTLATSSGRIKYAFVDNYITIAEVLQKLLNERQVNTEMRTSTMIQNSNSKNLDDLVTLKNLLDDNIITQEEFDKKKKEILDL